MQLWIRLACAAALAAMRATAGPVDFGVDDVKAALASRNLKTRFEYDLNLEPAETFRIEPLKAGGVHITGGDLRGLMYGLLEAGEQIRSTGRFSQVHGIPSTAHRGVRLFTTAAELKKFSVTEWRGYFEMLARDRLNHFTLVFAREDPLPVFGTDSFELPALRLILQTAADYGIDFTLGLWQRPGDAESLRKLLVACPQLRTIQMLDSSPELFKVLHDSGHRVAIDPRGALFNASFIAAANDAGVPVALPSPDWSGGFDIDAPGGIHFESRSLFYWLWGRLGYDPKAKLSRTDPPEEYRAAANLLSLLSAVSLSRENFYLWPAANPELTFDVPARTANWTGVATIREAVANRLEGVASAKRTPLQTADLLMAASAALDAASRPDVQLLALLGLYHAHKQRAAYALELFDQAHDRSSLDVARRELESALAEWSSMLRIAADSEGPPADLADVRIDLARVAKRSEEEASHAQAIPALTKPLARPQVTHVPVKTAHAEEPLILTLTTAGKDLQSVRLHYFAGGAPKILDQAAASLVTFTIPLADVPTGGVILYYFEILARDKSGWIEPEVSGPETPFGTPYYIVKVSGPTAPN